MANTKVTIKVASNAQELYVVGSTANLGAWDASKAVKAEKCAECGKFVVAKMFPAGEVVEFKVLTAADWSNVEKGAYGEEVENHAFTAAKGLAVEVEAYNFAK